MFGEIYVLIDINDFDSLKKTLTKKKSRVHPARLFLLPVEGNHTLAVFSFFLSQILRMTHYILRTETL